MEKLQDYIVKRREELGFNQTEFAIHSGVSAKQLSFIETGRTLQPRKDTLKKLSRALQVDYNELLDIAGYPQRVVKVSADLENLRKEADLSNITLHEANFIAEKVSQKILRDLGVIPKESPSPTLPPYALQMKFPEKPTMMHLVENVKCGTLGALIETGEMIEVPPSWQSKGNFCVRVKGDSMRPEGIIDGMIVLIKEGIAPSSGDILLVSGKGENPEEVTGVLKKAKFINNMLLLQDGNGNNLEPGESYCISGKAVKWGLL